MKCDVSKKQPTHSLNIPRWPGQDFLSFATLFILCMCSTRMTIKHMIVFDRDQDRIAPVVPIPFSCRIAKRKCRISRDKACLDHYTSDEVYLMWSQQPDTRRIFLHELSYEVTDEFDNNLEWTKVMVISRLGVFGLLGRHALCWRRRELSSTEEKDDHPT